jgi:hypothetical protein
MATIRLRLATKKAGQCRALECAAPLEWYETLAGRAMPMNAGATPLTHEQVEIYLDGIRTVVDVGAFDAAESHWVTCRAPEPFRRKDRR